SLRKAYEATFLSEDEARLLSPEGAAFLAKSRGNWQTILSFLNRHTADRRSLDLLASLSDKDLRDMPLDILEDSYNATSDQLSPRVENEMIITPFKQFLEKAWMAENTGKTELQPENLQKDPSKLVAWVKENVRLNPDQKSLRIAQTPVGVWRSRLTDTRSRDIFFVDLARSLGIEARKDVVTGKVQYKAPSNLHQKGAAHWIDVDFDAAEQKTAPTGTLQLTYEPTKTLDDPKYYSHFSVTRILDDGTTQLMNFEEGQVDMGGGTSWSNTFRKGARLDVGTYLLTTGTRMANGSVLAAAQTFNIAENQTTTLPLTLRQSDTEVSVIGSFDSESKFQLIENGKTSGKDPVSILSQTGRGYFVVGILGVGQEPTNHALRDIAKVKASLDKWGRPFVLLFENEAEAAKYQQENFGELPENIVYGIDKDGAIRQQIATQMKLQNGGQLPVFIIADTFNRVVFCSQGYTIGLGEQLVKVANKL
ncbi:MAG: transglutaminase domain-containing protein, partial [Prevotella sp.]|nr:transglutaminase domain-containing protein [Prevotella sp.]